jgi:hypothetical protein
LEGTGRSITEAVGTVGVFLVSPAFIVALSLLLVSSVAFGARATRFGRVWDVALAFVLALFGVVVGTHAFLEGGSWFTLTLVLLSLVALWLMVGRFALLAAPGAAKFGVLLCALAYSCWDIYVLGQLAGGDQSQQAGLPSLVLAIGELFAVLTPIAFFVACALPGNRWRSGTRWIVPVLLTVLFSAGNIADALANQGFTGVFTTWSLGINLVWPWPLYAVSLALFIYAVFTCFAHDSGKPPYANANTGLGLILLVFAGYALQLPYQHLIAVIAIMLLSGLAVPFAVSEATSRSYSAVQLEPPDPEFDTPHATQDHSLTT